MNVKKISWIEGALDMESEGEPVLIEQEWGNKGIGAIVFVLCLLAVLLPSIPTIIQMSKGTAKGNPLGAIIATFVIFIWPIYWGFNQFFLKRRLIISNDIIKFELISFIRTKKYEVKVRDYKQIEYGKSTSYSRSESGPGRTGKYFVKLPHKDRKSAVLLYENLQKQISEKRLQQYSKKLNLPIINTTPDKT